MNCRGEHWVSQHNDNCLVYLASRLWLLSNIIFSLYRSLFFSWRILICSNVIGESMEDFISRSSYRGYSDTYSYSSDGNGEYWPRSILAAWRINSLLKLRLLRLLIMSPVFDYETMISLLSRWPNSVCYYCYSSDPKSANRRWFKHRNNHIWWKPPVSFMSSSLLSRW